MISQSHKVEQLLGGLTAPQLPAGPTPTPTPTSTWEETAEATDPSPGPGLRCCLSPDGIAAGTSRCSSLPGMKSAAYLGSSCCICGLCYAKRVSISLFCLLPLRTALVAVFKITHVRLDPTWFPARPEGARPLGTLSWELTRSILSPIIPEAGWPLYSHSGLPRATQCSCSGLLLRARMRTPPLPLTSDF